MNTKRIASIALILGLMATNLAQAFADTIVDTANDKFTNGHEEKNKKNKDVKDAVDLVCMQTAVVARETAVINSMDTYNTTIKTALNTRMTALKAAWALTGKTARKEAVKKAWSAFKAEHKTAREILKKAKKDAWGKFNKDRKTCHATSDVKDEGNDADL